MIRFISFVPNTLTIFRLVVSFVLIPLIFRRNFAMATVVFALASISDFFDGYIARKFCVSSDLGAMLDPLADKVLVTVSYLSFACIKSIPIYVAAIVILRDIVILSIVVLCKIRSVELKIHPIMSSKINTAIQLLFIILVLVCNCLSINSPYLIGFFSIIVSVFTIFSGVDYAQRYYWIKDEIFRR